MPIPESGQLKLRGNGDGTGINEEVNGNVTATNVSLGALSTAAGLDTPPDAMREFYGYSSFTDPSITAQISFSSVNTSQMRVEFSYSNPNDGNASLESGFYFGTSTNMTSNTFYSEGTSTSTTRSPARVFSSLSSNTTYYCWGILKDTEDPARFTQLNTNMGTQATDYNYAFNSVDFYSNYQNINNTDTYNFKTYYNAINGSYTLHQTLNSTYNFCNGGTNQVPFMQFSTNRYNRLTFTGTSFADSCRGYGYGTAINTTDGNYNNPANPARKFYNFTTYGDVDCRSGNNTTWNLINVGQTNPTCLTFYAQQAQGDTFGCQFTAA